MARTRTKPSHYPAVSFHAIRFGSLLAATIVSSILIYFCYELKHDGFKLPWTFLVVLGASLLTLLVLLLTSFVHCCGTLSPLFSLILNIPILILWLLGFSLLCWNMFGTLAHSCSLTNWASQEGVMVCQTYKALFTFTLMGALSQIAQVVLDGKARRTQTRLGRYDKMAEPQDVKQEAIPIIVEPPADEMSYPLQQIRDESPGWRPGPRRDEPRGYADAHEPMTLEQFAYQAPQQHMHYDSGRSYHHQGDDRRGY